MGKRKDPSPNKKPQLTQKVDSKKVEPNTTSKTSEIDYPDELAEYIAKKAEKICKSMGLKKGQPIPDDKIEEFTKELIKDEDGDQLLNRFDIKVKTKDSQEAAQPEETPEVDDGYIPTTAELTDEEVANFSLDQIPVEKDGTRILTTVEIDPPENSTGTLLLSVPIKTDEEMIKKNVVMHIIYPYIEAIPIKEIEADESVLKGKSGIAMGDFFYATSAKVFESYLQILEKSGCNVQLTEDTDNKTFLESVMKDQYKPRKNGYYDNLHEYWYGGEIYHENDVIWLELFPKTSKPGNLKGTYANLEKSDDSVFEPCDVSTVDINTIIKEDGKKVLSKRQEFELFEKKNSKRLRKLWETPTPSEKVFYLAKEYAKTKDTVGFVAVCLDGKFLVPCYSSVNMQTFEVEYLINLFNAFPCLSSHHACRGVVIADYGNMPITTFVRYLKDTIFDWRERIEQELNAYRYFDEDFDPYANPYDDPKSGWGKPSDIGDNGDDEN